MWEVRGAKEKCLKYSEANPILVRPSSVVWQAILLFNKWPKLHRCRRRLASQTCFVGFNKNLYLESAITNRVNT